MKKIFVGNLPPDTSEKDLQAIFSEFGTVRSTKIAIDVFSRQCKGFGFIEMEGHEARAAITALNGRDYHGKILRVHYESPRAGRRSR